jgi:rod shape-determining protein MreC
MTEFTQRRPVFSLLVLVLINLFLLSIQVRDSEGRLLLRSIGITLLAPPAEVVNYAFSRISDGLYRYVWLVGVEERNRELEKENVTLKLDLWRLRSLQTMVEHTDRFKWIESRYSFETLLASVIWRNVPLYSQRVFISVGTAQGVTTDCAIIAAEGVVGRVFAPSLYQAEVELLTDQNAAAGAVLFHTRLHGIVQGMGGETLSLNFISSSETVPDGELVYTSGTDRIYPKGLPIGTVMSSRKEGIYQSILVRPQVDLSRLEEVMVVLAGKGENHRNEGPREPKNTTR